MLTVENAAVEAAHFIERIPSYSGNFAGRGIVTCAGGVKYLTCAWVLIKTLRRLGCTLPIEVWYLGEGEGDPDWIKMAKPFDVECIDAFAVQEKHPHPRLRGWEAKAYAIRHCRFKEVLFLDADNIPVTDPTFLFDCNEYRETGAVFWPDGFRAPSGNASWNVFDVSYRNEPEQESGQLIVDKERAWKALQLCNWYNEHSDFFYDHVYGDKDTFRLAWHRVGLPYAMPPHAPEPIPFALCQHDFAGRRIFQHRIHDKWSLHGNHRIADFWHESACRESIQELREQWNPLAWPTRSLTARDRHDARSRVGARFVLERAGASRRMIEFGPNGYVSRGQNPRCCFWWSDAGDLVLADANARPACRLRPTGGDAWGGHRIDNPRESYRLLPAA